MKHVLRAASFSLLAMVANHAVAATSKGSGLASVDERAAIRASVSYCAGGLERFLPGQYYFCAAVRDYGRGHDGLARERLRDAAYWASKPAQYVLGLMNFNGEDKPANRPLGVAWLALAAERHDPRFEPAFARAFLELTPAERAQANVYWTDMRAKYADATAGKRAQRTYLAEMRNLQAVSMFGGSVFIEGLTPATNLGNGALDNYGNSTGLMGGSGFGVERLLGQSAEELFRGMEGHVVVGAVTPVLVPIGSVSSIGSNGTPNSD